MEQEQTLPEETSLPDEAEQEEVDQDVTAYESGGEESQDQTEPDDDSEEVEFNGKHLKLPKDVAADLKSMQKDYTVKTQAVADQRKAFESQVQFFEENKREVAQLEAIKMSLEEFSQVDWTQVQDQAMFQQLAAQEKQLQSKFNALAGNLNAKYQKSTLEKQLNEAKQIEESESEIKRMIKDWSPELDSKLQRFAADRYGFPKDSIGEYKKDPKVAKLLHDAYVGQQIIQKQMNKPKPVQDAKPVTNLSAKATSVRKNPAAMSPEQYAKWRRNGYK